MDVQMPGLDGITACSKIRESGCNRATPIVFVTAHGDITTRTRSKFSGGNDLVGKPILTAEINLKALAFALRGRLQKIKVERHVNSLAPENHNGSSHRRRRPRSDKQARRR
jgi:CheY-like chemotaxis protein